jgi:ankyrin repeat protein
MSPTGVVYEEYDESGLLNMAMAEAAANGHVDVISDFLAIFEHRQEAMQAILRGAAGTWQPDVVDFITERVEFEKPFLLEMLQHTLSGKHRDFVTYHKSDWGKQYRVVSRLIDAGGIDVSLPENSAPLLRQAIRRIETQGGLGALLDKGVDPNTRLKNGCTALHLLMSPLISPDMGEDIDDLQFEMHEVGIRLLLDKGASIAIEDDDGATALHWAAERCETQDFLRYHLPTDGALPLSMNHYGESVLHYAAAGGKHETIEYLLTHCNFDANAVNSTNAWTPVIYALAPNGARTPEEAKVKTEANAVKSTRILLRHGANPHVVTADGWTVVHLLGSYVDLSEREYGRVVLSEDASAAALARELLSGPLKLEPAIESLSKVYYRVTGGENKQAYDVKTVNLGDLWGGRLAKVITEGMNTSPPTIHVVQGRTPLHWAAERGAAGVAKVLRELKGADEKAVDSDEKLPWDLAHNSRLIQDRRVQQVTQDAVK